MTTASKERSLWKSNPEWYKINEVGEFELTDKAPLEAVESFREWCIPRKAIKCPIKELAPVE